MNINDIVGATGVGILLIAYFLSVFKMMVQDGLAYLLLNMLGAGIACYASYRIPFYPFVVLEGTWMIVSAVALGRKVASSR